MLAFFFVPILLAVLLYAYIKANDQRLFRTPAPIRSLGLTRLTPEDVRDELEAHLHGMKGFDEERMELEEQLPPKTGRRYIVVGGNGFLGGWVIVHLLKRGEDPRNIRIVDLSPTPVNEEVKKAIDPDGIQYVQANICDAESTYKAFSAPWPATSSIATSVGITVFHTAASIRYFERLPIFLHRSMAVNFHGTKNVLEAAKRIGVEVLVYTSSAGVGHRSVNLLGWPWSWDAREEKLYQKLVDCEEEEKEKVEEDYYASGYWSNYCISKAMADRLVRKADGTPLATSSNDRNRGEKGMNTAVLRTGCIRAGNLIYGTRQGPNSYPEAFLKNTASNPVWMKDSVQSCVYVENCSLAHLLFERRLLDLIDYKSDDTVVATKSQPDIGGQSFYITDPGPPIVWDDMFTIFTTLTGGRCRFTNISPSLMLLVAHLVQAYCLFQYFITTTSFPFVNLIPSLPQVLKKMFPPITGDLGLLQPSTFTGNVYIIVDDSRARLSPEEGGLGYRGVWTTRAGLRRTWEDFVVGKNGNEI